MQNGSFYVWVETDEALPVTVSKRRKKLTIERHPQQLDAEKLADFLSNELGLSSAQSIWIANNLSTQYFVLPSTETQPLPSLELTRYLETDGPEPTAWRL